MRKQKRGRGRPLLPVERGSTGALIRAARIKAELTIEQVAEAIGGTPSMISSIERNERAVSIARLRDIATACGVADFCKLIGTD